MTKKLNITIAISYAILITYASLRPVTSSYTGGFAAAKELLFNLTHLPAYTLMFILVFMAFTKRGKRELVLSFTISASFGAVLEFLQTFSPGRFPSIKDALVNIAGCGLGYFILSKTNKLKLFSRKLDQNKLPKSPVDREPWTVDQDMSTNGER